MSCERWSSFVMPTSVGAPPTGATQTRYATAPDAFQRKSTGLAAGAGEAAVPRGGTSVVGACVSQFAARAMVKRAWGERMGGQLSGRMASTYQSATPLGSETLAVAPVVRAMVVGSLPSMETHSR